MTNSSACAYRCRQDRQWVAPLTRFPALRAHAGVLLTTVTVGYAACSGRTPADAHRAIRSPAPRTHVGQEWKSNSVRFRWFYLLPAPTVLLTEHQCRRFINGSSFAADWASRAKATSSFLSSIQKDLHIACCRRKMPMRSRGSLRTRRGPFGTLPRGPLIESRRLRAMQAPPANSRPNPAYCRRWCTTRSHWSPLPTMQAPSAEWMLRRQLLSSRSFSKWQRPSRAEGRRTPVGHHRMVARGCFRATRMSPSRPTDSQIRYLGWTRSRERWRLLSLLALQEACDTPIGAAPRATLHR